MAMNIGCFMGCINPVIGQCSGYKGNCGQFYCDKHSRDKLCGNCAERKAADERLDVYIQIARKVPTKPGASIFFAIGVIAFCLFGMSQMYLYEHPPFAAYANAIAVMSVGSVPFLAWAYKKSGERKRFIANAGDLMPGFREFYQRYKELEDKAEAESSRQAFLGLLGGIVGGAIEGVVKGTGEAARHMIKDVTKPAESRLRDR